MKMILQDMDLINPFVGCIQTMTTKWTQDQTMTAISQDKANIIEVQLDIDIISPINNLPSPSKVLALKKHVQMYGKVMGLGEGEG